jgi:hypothetical protein
MQIQNHSFPNYNEEQTGKIFQQLLNKNRNSESHTGLNCTATAGNKCSGKIKATIYGDCRSLFL